MGKQNDAFTAYLGRAEVLADLYNGCLYQGEEVVQAGNLCEVQQFYQQGLSERVKRPTARRRKRDAIRAFWNEKSYVLLAAEAQNQPHLTMPFRCMEYDLAEYARQLRYIRLKSEGKLKTGVEYLSKMGRKDHLTPIVTIVLYHGTEPWDAPKKLSEMMELEEIDPILKQMVQEYQIYVFQLEELQEEYFQTNLRELIGLMKRRSSKTEIQEYCRKHADRISRMDVATYDMICVMLNLKELQDKKEKYLKNGKGSIDMCKAMEEWAEELREEGKSAGIKEGMKEGELRGMQKAKESMLKLVAKMSENGDTEYCKTVGAGSISEDDGQIRNGVIEKVHYKEITLAKENKIIGKADGEAWKNQISFYECVSVCNCVSEKSGNIERFDSGTASD